MNATFWRRLTVLVACLGLAAIVWGRAPAQRRAADLPTAPAIDHPAPEFTLLLLDGSSASLSQWRGQPVVLNFWASWCAPCRAEMPELQRAHEHQQDAGLVVLGINQGEDAATVSAYRQQLGLTFPALLDRRAGVSEQYLVKSLPTTFFIDRNGVIRGQFIGPMSDAVLVEQLSKIFP